LRAGFQSAPPHRGHLRRLVLAPNPHDAHIQFIGESSWQCGIPTLLFRSQTKIGIRSRLWGFHVYINVGLYPRPRFIHPCFVSRDQHTVWVEDKQLEGFVYPQTVRLLIHSSSCYDYGQAKETQTAQSDAKAITHADRCGEKKFSQGREVGRQGRTSRQAETVGMQGNLIACCFEMLLEISQRP
jgi:hypothetical protein